MISATSSITKANGQRHQANITFCSNCQTEILLIYLKTIENNIIAKISCNNCFFNQIIQLKDYVALKQQNQHLQKQYISNNSFSDNYNKYCIQCQKWISIGAKSDDES